MREIKKRLILNKNDYYKIHLTIINSVLPEKLTNREIDVLSGFMSLKGDIADKPFSTFGRDKVKKLLNISSGGLGNYLKSLKTKGFIYLEGEVLKILPILIPEEKEQFYKFKIENNE
jgi:hypothetical protein